MNLNLAEFARVADQFDNDKCPDARNNRLVAAKAHFGVFMLLYMGHILTTEPGAFHFESYSHARKNRYLELWPRGYGKSRTWSVGYPLWLILCNPFDRNLDESYEEITCISNAGRLAKKWVAKQKQELTTNKRILADFRPEKGDVWASDEYKITIDGRITGHVFSLGAGAAARGEHPTQYVIDDLEDSEEARSETQRQNISDYFWQVIMGSLILKGPNATRIRIVGTCVHPLGLLPKLRNLSEYWTSVKYAVYDAEGKSLWPAYQSIADLRRKEQELTDAGQYATWCSEYLNQPIVSENPVVLEKWIQHYDKDDLHFNDHLRKGVYTAIAIDPASSRRDTADFTAIVTVSATFEKEPRYYVRVGGVVRGHWPMHRSIAELARLYKEFNANLLIFETTAFQQTLSDEFLRYCELEGWHPQYVDIKPHTDKVARVHNIASLLSRGRVFFDPSDDMIQRLIDELIVFPSGDHDDLVDGFTYDLTEMRQRVRARHNQQDEPCIVLPGKPRPYTGIIG